MTEVIPTWAQALIEKVTILNERLPNHIDFTERNIADHEERLRAQEATTATLTSTVDRLAKLEENELEIFTRLRRIETRLWMSIGGITVIVTALEIWSNLVANGAFAKK